MAYAAIIYVAFFDDRTTITKDVDNTMYYVNSYENTRRSCGDKDQIDPLASDYSKYVKRYADVYSFCAVFSELARNGIIENEYLQSIDCNSLWRSDSKSRIDGKASQEFFAKIQNQYNDMTKYDIAYVAQDKTVCVQSSQIYLSDEGLQNPDGLSLVC